MSNYWWFYPCITSSLTSTLSMSRVVTEPCLTRSSCLSLVCRPRKTKKQTRYVINYDGSSLHTTLSKHTHHVVNMNPPPVSFAFCLMRMMMMGTALWTLCVHLLPKSTVPPTALRYTWAQTAHRSRSCWRVYSWKAKRTRNATVITSVNTFWWIGIVNKMKRERGTGKIGFGFRKEELVGTELWTRIRLSCLSRRGGGNVPKHSPS
jgi:hypothetical protein